MQANSVVEKEELQKVMWSPYPDHSLALWALPPQTYHDPPTHLDTHLQLQSKQRRMQRWQISRDFKPSDPSKLPANNGKGKTTEILATHRLNFGNQSIVRLSIPQSSIQYLTNLVEIRMPQNKLSQLPHSLFMLTQLEILNLENNLLDEHCACDQWWLKLVHLRVLFLADNRFTRLSGSLGKMPKLFYLDVSDNRKLSYLPAELLTSPSIGTLTANRCSMVMLDQLYDKHGQFIVPRNLQFPTLKEICIKTIHTAIQPYLNRKRDRKDEQIQGGIQGQLLFEACEEIGRNPGDYFVADLLTPVLDASVQSLPSCSVCDNPVFYSIFSLVRLVDTWSLPFYWLCCSANCRDYVESLPVSSQLINKYL
ncbi:hypothetical protein LPJ64_001212 [Coemansia asiatica]|uniref:Uncharacterized protein n=1 Tax=Coemansia asiatica TaxID=1052880 RepID=A0A9W7XQZ9_9FUNG|nr:hypothetical protein LPJ64_001212 [Coemansia asiatica]